MRWTEAATSPRGRSRSSSRRRCDQRSGRCDEVAVCELVHANRIAKGADAGDARLYHISILKGARRIHELTAAPRRSRQQEVAWVKGEVGGAKSNKFSHSEHHLAGG